ncbi:HAD family phosphatase [Fluviicola sp.]|uniref:HAD family hydrolase n=1 Tax=Fluviicola sp. TaxID=1917219 RepID=UPI0031DA35B1
MTHPKAFLFDLNGTIIDDMDFHLQVWNRIINEDLHGGLTLEQVKKQMYGKNHELLERVFGKGTLSEETIAIYSQKKEELYKELYRPYVALIPGLSTLLEKAERSGISMAIGSAADRSAIDFIVDSLDIRSRFQAIVGAEDVTKSKPDPEVFLKGAALLGVEPESCIVFEDVPKGAEAAMNAGMKVVIVTTTHHPEEFTKYPNVLFFIEDFNDPRLADLFK